MAKYIQHAVCSIHDAVLGIPATCRAQAAQRLPGGLLMARVRPARPTIALAMGDPAGISPELTARDWRCRGPRAARLVVVGDRRVLEGVRRWPARRSTSGGAPTRRPRSICARRSSSTSAISIPRASSARSPHAPAASSRSAISGPPRTRRRRPRRCGVLHAVQQGGDALAHPGYDDEIGYSRGCARH